MDSVTLVQTEWSKIRSGTFKTSLVFMLSALISVELMLKMFLFSKDWENKLRTIAKLYRTIQFSIALISTLLERVKGVLCRDTSFKTVILVNSRCTTTFQLLVLKWVSKSNQAASLEISVASWTSLKDKLFTSVLFKKYWLQLVTTERPKIG